jgi:cobalt-zinc-cadmium efflux system membrane fusion protein
MTDVILRKAATLSLWFGAAMVAACGGADAPAKQPEEATPVGKADTAEADADAPADAVVTLDSVGLRLAGVQVVKVAPVSGEVLEANGTITYDANRVAVISPRAESRVMSVRADLGQWVGAGAVLAVLESPEVGQLRAELERARATVEIAGKNYEREQRLNAQEISSQKELLEAENALRGAEADYNSAVSRLKAIGATEGEGPAFGLTTPVAGTVLERNASPGQVVGPEHNLFTVANLRHVWITVDVYEGDLGHVREGAKVTVVPSALAGEQFPGRVTYAGGVVDTTSRAFKVRVEVENPKLRLRPGMFARVRIQSPTSPEGSEGGDSAAVAVPEIAVQDLDGKPVVFVADDVAGRFVVRPVTVGSPLGSGMVRVTRGLSSGERVVAAGAFQLKAELTKASFGEEE